jgi:hypothetical protein
MVPQSVEDTLKDFIGIDPTQLLPSHLRPAGPSDDRTGPSSRVLQQNRSPRCVRAGGGRFGRPAGGSGPAPRRESSPPFALLLRDLSFIAPPPKNLG